MSSYNFTIQSIGINTTGVTESKILENKKLLESTNITTPIGELSYLDNTITMENLSTLEYNAIYNFLTSLKKKNLIVDFNTTSTKTTTEEEREKQETEPKYINTILKINDIDDEIIHKLKLTPEQLKIFKIAYYLLNKFLIDYDITINFSAFTPNDFKDIKEIEESSFYQTREEKHS